MTYCPNCSSELDSSNVESCPKCNASFVGVAAWRPVSAPRDAAPLRSAAWQYVLGVPLILIAVALFALAAIMGANGGELAAVPAMLYLVSGVWVLVARSALGKTFAVLLAMPLLLLLFALQNVCLNASE